MSAESLGDGRHTLGRWPADSALRHPDKTAIAAGDAEISYRELADRAAHLAGVLRADCRPGDRIATLTGNSPDHVVVFFACALARLVLVPLSWRLSAREIAAQLVHAEPALLLVEPEFTELATAALARLPAPPPTALLGRGGIESTTPEAASPTSAADSPTPEVDSRAPVADSHALAVDSHAPAVDSTGPVADSRAPAVGSTTPAGNSHAPAAHSHAPTVESAARAADSPTAAADSHAQADDLSEPAGDSHTPAIASPTPAAESPTPAADSLTPAADSRAPAVDSRGPVRDDDPLLMIFTSGTAGRPKGVVLSHANCFWTNLSLSLAVPLQPDDVVLSVLPQFHVGGWNVQPLLALWVGATVLLERTFDAGRVLRLIADRSVTTMMGVPANYLFLARHPDFAATDLTSLRGAVVGGAPMPEPLLRTWHARGVGLVQGYGLTEAAPNVLCLPGAVARQKVGFAGRPYPYVEVALADPATGEMDPDLREGELLVRGPAVFTGYWRDQEATARALPDGWLHTGDLVWRDDDGYYKILDRLDDMFVSGGENVSPSEVENVLYGHPAVAEVAVVGRPDERWGTVGVAYVVPSPGSAVDAEGLIDYCRGELARYKVPREIRVVGELPHSAVGKLLRGRLRTE